MGRTGSTTKMSQAGPTIQIGWTGPTTKTGRVSPITQMGWGPDEPDDPDNLDGPGRLNFEIHPNLAELTSTKIWKNLV